MFKQEYVKSLSVPFNFMTFKILFRILDIKN